MCFVDSIRAVVEFYCVVRHKRTNPLNSRKKEIVYINVRCSLMSVVRLGKIFNVNYQHKMCKERSASALNVAPPQNVICISVDKKFCAFINFDKLSMCLISHLPAKRTYFILLQTLTPSYQRISCLPFTHDAHTYILTSYTDIVLFVFVFVCTIFFFYRPARNTADDVTFAFVLLALGWLWPHTKKNISLSFRIIPHIE